MDFLFDESLLFGLALGLFIVLGFVICLYFQIPSLVSKPSSEYIPDPKSNQEIRRHRSDSDVFIRYDHSSIEDWAKWILTQDSLMQELARDKLAEYLQKPIKELGVISTEVIKALALIKHPNHFQILSDFITQLRPNWKLNASSETFYEAAILAIAKHKSEQAFSLIRSELQELSHCAELEHYKIALFKATAELDLTKELIELSSKALFDHRHSLETRKNILAQLDPREPTEQKIFLLGIFAELVQEFTNKQLGFEDVQILRLVLDKTFVYIKAQDSAIWDCLLQSLKLRYLQEELTILLVEALDECTLDLDAHQYFSLINLPGEIGKSFYDAAFKKFQLSDFEKLLMQEPVLLDSYPFETDIIRIEKLKKIFVPEFMDPWVRDFEIILNRKRNPNSRNDSPILGAATVSGDAEDLKLYVARACAVNSNKAFIYIDAAGILDIPDKLFELQKNIQRMRPCVVFVSNLEVAFKNKGLDNTRIHDLLKVFKELSSNPNISVMISIKDDEVVAKKQYGIILNIVYNLKEIDSVIRRNLIQNYELRLLERREAKEMDVEGLMSTLSSRSLLEFASDLHRYVRTSMLCFGKIVSFNEYLELDKSKDPAIP